MWNINVFDCWRPYSACFVFSLINHLNGLLDALISFSVYFIRTKQASSSSKQKQQHESINKCINDWINKWMNKLMISSIIGWMKEWMNKWANDFNIFTNMCCTTCLAIARLIHSTLKAYQTCMTDRRKTQGDRALGRASGFQTSLPVQFHQACGTWTCGDGRYFPN